MTSVLKSYIIGKAAVLADVVAPEVVLVPIVAPESIVNELPDRFFRISDYRQDAIQADTFESFLLLIDKIIAECGLSPAEDQTVIAALLNRYRMDAGLSPL